MIENRNVNIITDADGKKLVLVNDIRFKAKMRDDWSVVEEYLNSLLSIIRNGFLPYSVFTQAGCSFLFLLQEYQLIFPMNMQVQKAALP